MIDEQKYKRIVTHISFESETYGERRLPAAHAVITARLVQEMQALRRDFAAASTKQATLLERIAVASAKQAALLERVANSLERLDNPKTRKPSPLPRGGMNND